MRLVVVSNRLPFTVSLRNGKPHFEHSSGGLTTGLWSYLKRARQKRGHTVEHIWVGWPGSAIAEEHAEEVNNHAGLFNAAPVFLSEETADSFYHGFCNKTLWPLFHYFPTLARYEEDNWREYRKGNEAFAQALLRVLQPDDVLWVHDYQLMLLPGLIRKHFPEMPIGFFLHIPFPSYEVFRLLPRAWRSELIEGVLGASLVGFHTYDYTRDFLTSVLRTVGYEHQLGSIPVGERVVKVDTFPMGIDFERFAQATVRDGSQAGGALKRKSAEHKVIFSVDRLDYTKGLQDRLRGYELFLKKHPEWHGKVTFVLSVAPSRTGVETYRAMRRELEQMVGRIAGTYGTLDWTPLIYQYRTLEFEEIVGMYQTCDVALITPLRDGMNLVAKEFVASRRDKTGVLILSEMAGAAKEMGEALIINPFHSDEFARTLAQALTMPIEEQIRRNEILQERLRRYDVNRWAEDFTQAMVASQRTESARRARILNGKAQVSVLQRYRVASSRALLLDYDGTLVPFAETPKAAAPDTALLHLIRSLAEEPRNQLAIVSGRRRADLQEWFGTMPVTLIAEHGMWLRGCGGSWRQLRPAYTEWKDRIRPILQLHLDRLPGALLEEKEFSLAWHYRKADPEQASLRAKELSDDLSGFTRNIDVQVLEGKKVIEVRVAGVNKGTAALEWLGPNAAPFVLGIGDDWTDEDLFRALPPNSLSIRVGVAKTAAQYYLTSHAAVRRLLGEMAEGDAKDRRTRAVSECIQPAGSSVETMGLFA